MRAARTPGARAADWIFFGLIVATLFAYRIRGGRRATFQAPAYPLLHALFVAAAAFVVYSSVVSNPRNAVYGTLLIGAGVPVYLGWRRRASLR